MAIIRIKRSGSGGSPGALAQGEMGYSFLGGTQSNGGDRLYIGTGTETAGVAANIAVIGGKYFTDKLSHVPGTLTANSGIITDANNKIDVLNVDNITINGNEISSTDTNGNITLNPNGTGAIDASSAQIINLANPTANSHAVTLSYLQATFSANLNISGDTGTDTITVLNETLNFAGGTGLTSVVSSNTVTMNLDNTAVTPGSYGNATSISTFTVDQQGRLTAAGTANIATILNIAGDTGTDGVSLISDTLTVSGGTGLTSVATNNNITINLDNTAVTPNTYGSATATTTFTVDQQGRITAAAANTISIPASQVNDFSSAVNTILGQSVTPTSNVQFNNGLFNGNLIIDGNFTVGGNSTTITAQNLSITDNMIFLNQGSLETVTNAVGNGANVLYTTTTNNYQVGFNVVITGMTPSSFNNTGAAIIAANSTSFTIASSVTDTFVSGGSVRGQSSSNPDLGFAGGYNDGTYAHAGFFRDATDGVFKVFKNYTPEPDASVFIDTTHASFALADMRANNFVGTLQGIANTALALNTSRTIALSGDVVGSISFDGSANVSISTTIQANSVALGTDTTGDYVATVGVTADTGLSVTGTGEGAAVTLAGINANNTVKGVASFDANNFTVSSGAVSSIIANNTVKGVASFDANNFTVSSGAVSSIIANNTVKGVASFDANNFTVSSGAVSISAIDGGTY